jgi:Family of unknown function (DUF6069)
MVSAASATAQEERVSGRRLLWIGPLAIVAAVVANQIIRILAVSLFNISPEFPPLQPGPPLMFTVMGVLGAVIVFAIVGRLSRRPIRLFRTIALIVLVLTFLPDIGLLMTGAMPGTTPVAVGTLATMHVVAWAITIWMLTTLAREQA